MTTAQKLWLGFGTLIVIMILIVLALFVWMHQLDAQVDTIATEVGPVNEAAHTLEVNVNAIAASVWDHLHSPAEIHRQRVLANIQDFNEALQRYQRFATTEREIELAEQTAEAFTRYSVLGEALLAAHDEGRLSEADLALLMDLRIELDELLDRLQAESMNELGPARQRISDTVSDLKHSAIGLLGLGVVAAILAGGIVGRAIIVAEEQLKASDSRNAAIVESALDGIITIDQSGNIVEYNPAAEAIFGYSRQDALGRELAELIIPEGRRELHRRKLAKTESNGESWILGRRLELTALRQGGEEVPVEVAITRTGTDNRPLYTGFVRDISARIQSETELAEQIRLLQLTADVGTSLTEGTDLHEVLQGCTEAIVRDLNAAFARIWTYNEREKVLELKASSGIYTHLDGKHARIPLGKYKIGMIAQERRPHQTNSVIGDPRIPEQEWALREGLVAFAGYPLLVENRLVGVMGMFARQRLTSASLRALAAIADEVALGIRHEIARQELLVSNETLEQRVLNRTAELAETNTALLRSNSELEQFASVASHDLQEPLRKIQAFGDRLNAKYHDTLDEQGRQYVQRMQAAAGRMRRLIDDLLSFSRVTTKAQPFERVDLRELAEEVISDLEGRVQDSGGRIELGDLPTIDADPVQMQQLLQNLIANGLKFRKPDVPPVVRIRGEIDEVDPSICHIEISDNGIGFDEIYLDRIFEVFQRLHGRLEYEGTGMGLAICRKIAHRHGGTITAHSTPGEGATFVITLPVDHVPTENHAEAEFQNS